MKQIAFDSKGVVSSRVVNVEYFPLFVAFDVNSVCDKIYQINYDKNNFAEFGLGLEGTINSFRIICCSNYKIISEKFKVGIYEEGVLCLKPNTDMIAKEFQLKIYVNAIELILSLSLPVNRYKNGNLIFSFDNHYNLVSVAIVNMLSEDISHTINELYYCSKK